SRNGRFDPELYRRLLAANRLTPSLFEAQQTMELLRNKARTVVVDSVALTPAEIVEAQALMAQQPKGESASGPPAGDRILQAFLFQKQQRALLAYKEAVKARLPIEIHRELL
ncbi:MAG: SurA N-terminal domain-containing protein, partial [Nitrospiraceae bacterium]